ncbi:MAG TPA: hypothetical protein VGD98_10065 [Ktedonobacteraceae bacterium]
MSETSDIWTGKASSYARARPTPPPALLDLLTQLIQLPHPALVVDLGSGTGLASASWGELAERVIGIEPNADMRKEAVHNVESLDRLAHMALQSIGSEPIPWYFSYRVRIGIK